MKDDILAPVRQKLLDENQHLLVKPPQDLETNFVKQGGQAGRAILRDAAGIKLRFVAAVPAAIAAGIIDYLGVPRAGDR